MAKPNDQMRKNAKRGLELRKEYGRGGTDVGVARARDISNNKDLSDSTIKRMYSYFSRHSSNYDKHYGEKENDGGENAFTIAWLLWGGNAGYSWAKKEVKRINNEEERMMEEEKDVSEIVEEIESEEIDIEELAEEAEEPEELNFDEERSLGKVEHRSMEIGYKPIDEDKRTAMIAVSTEEPVMRSFGYEVLEHSKDAIDLDFLGSGRAPLLLDHDPEKQIGVVESVELDESTKRLRAKVRFGKNGLAREAFDDVVDGIRANISVGYSISKLEKKDKDTYIAKRWRPVEASLVSIPADVTVGVGRSSETSINPEEKPTEQIKETIMSDTVDIAAIEAEARKAAQRNAAEIAELGARHNLGDMAREAIAKGISIESFRGDVLEKIGSTAALENKEIGMDKEEVKRFSLIKAIRALANPHDARAQHEAAFEFECSRAAAQQYGANAQGIMMPADVLKTWGRDLNSADESDLFGDDYRGGDFIDVLRNASSVMQAGATMLSGLSGDVKIPKKLTAASAAWIASEGGAASESEMTVGNISMTPKTLGAFTDVTRQLLIQSSLDVENLIRDDLVKAMGLAIDKAALEGTGTSGQPTGILNTTGVNTTTFAAANPTFAEIVAMETALRNDNVNSEGLAYILPSAINGALKTTEKASGTAQFVTDGRSMNGYRTVVSNQGTAGNVYLGDFSDLLIGMFGTLDLTVDPYSLSTTGSVRVVALQSVDTAVRHAQSFCVSNDGV